MTLQISKNKVEWTIVFISLDFYTSTKNRIQGFYFLISCIVVNSLPKLWSPCLVVLAKEVLQCQGNIWKFKLEDPASSTTLGDGNYAMIWVSHIPRLNLLSVRSELKILLLHEIVIRGHDMQIPNKCKYPM